MLQHFRTLLAGAFLSSISQLAYAQDFPTRPLRILVPYTAGRVIDLLTDRQRERAEISRPLSRHARCQRQHRHRRRCEVEDRMATPCCSPQSFTRSIPSSPMFLGVRSGVGAGIAMEEGVLLIPSRGSWLGGGCRADGARRRGPAISTMPTRARVRLSM